MIYFVGLLGIMSSMFEQKGKSFWVCLLAMEHDCKTGWHDCLDSEGNEYCGLDMSGIMARITELIFRGILKDMKYILVRGMNNRTDL
jgi:hypothetical protein